MNVTSLSSNMGKSSIQKYIWSLFLRLFLIFIYVLLGTGLLCIIVNSNNQSYNDKYYKTLDSERRELLNVLWAESLVQSEHEWSVIANQKLDNYEKSLKTAMFSCYGINTKERPELKNKINKVLALIMTINDFGEPYDNILGYFSLILYIFGGIVLFYVYLEKFIEIINNLRISFTKIAGIFFFFNFCYTVIHEILVEEDEEKPFFKNFLNTFYVATTISKNQKDENSLLLSILQVGSTSLFFSLILIGAKIFGNIVKHYEENLEVFEYSFNIIYSIPYKIYEFIQKLFMYLLNDDGRNQKYKKNADENDEYNIFKNYNSLSNNIMMSSANSTLSSSRKGSLRLSKRSYDSLHEEEEGE
uniref:Ion_trans_2 domain-containing protein n=1 Tax=Strongyloides papillosus TaxID=174720 RepID=A0A0N5BHA2_STREA